MTIKSVLFDLDGTLLDRDASIEQFIRSQRDRLSTYLNHIPESEYTARFIELDCQGHVWKDKVYQSLVEQFQIKGLSWQDLLKDYETNFRFHCLPFPYLLETLNALRKEGYLLGIITNGMTEFQYRSIDGLGIRDYFDPILISEAEGLRKPEAAIFQRALEKLNLSATESVFVGDNLEVDILGAKSAGLKTIWKRNLHWLEVECADAAIDELKEILTIIHELESNLK